MESSLDGCVTTASGSTRLNAEGPLNFHLTQKRLIWFLCLIPSARLLIILSDLCPREKILRLVSQGEDAEKQESFSLSLNHLPPLNSLLLWWQMFPKPCSVKLVKYSIVPGPEGGCNNSGQISPTKEHIWGHCRLEMFLKSIWNEKGGEEVNRAEQRGENWRQKAFRGKYVSALRLHENLPREVFRGKYVSALPLLPLGLSHSANCLCRWLTLKL